MSWADLADSAINATHAVFGEDVTYTCQGYPAIPVSWPFQRAYQQIDLSGQVPLSTTVPRLDCRVADLPVPPKKGDIAIVRGVTYEVQDVQNDGDGAAALILKA